MTNKYWVGSRSIFGGFGQCIGCCYLPDAKFQEAKSDYLGPLIVTPKMVAKKIKAMKNHLEWMEFLQNY